MVEKEFLIFDISGTGMAGINRFGGRNYYMSWQDSSAQVRNTSGTGSTPGTTAGRGAWILSLLKLNKSMTGLRDSSTVRFKHQIKQ